MANTLKRLLGASISLGVSLVAGSTYADNSLGQRDNLSSGINDRQKAEMAVPAGFISGSSLNGLLRNYYFSRDNHDTPARLDQREWVQGAYLSFRSGYTVSPIGVGIDNPRVLWAEAGWWRGQRRCRTTPTELKKRTGVGILRHGSRIETQRL